MSLYSCERVFIRLLIEGLLAASAAEVERISLEFRFVLCGAYVHRHPTNRIFGLLRQEGQF
jgi:hypothetical protein